ncbi:MAG: hypothetical protein ACLFN9_23260, partial [Desulfococcaceae bacterium]
AHDAVSMLADAFRRAGSDHPQRVRKALAATWKFPTASGSITFDRNGDPDGKTAGILKREGGRWRPFRALGPDGAPLRHPGTSANMGETIQ